MISREAPLPAQPATELRSTRPGKALCAMCMGAYPETSMTVVDGDSFCPDCSPMTGRRGVSEAEAPDGRSAELPPAPPANAYHFQEETGSGGASRALLFGLAVLLVGGVVFAAMTLLGGDRIDKLLSGVDSGRDDRVMLVQKYSPGEVLYYSARGKLTGEAEGSVFRGLLSQSGSAEIGATLGGRMAMDVLSVDDRGNARLRTTLEGVHAEMELVVDGQKMPLPPGLMDMFSRMNGMQVVMEVDPFGEPLSEPTVHWPNGPSGGNAGFADLAQGQLSGVPRKEIQVGDTWTASAELPSDMGPMPFGDLKPSLDFKVEGFKRLSGRDCLVISVSGDMSGGEGFGAAGLPGDVDLDIDVKGAIFFDARAGRMVKSAMDITFDMSVAFGADGIEVHLKLELDVDLE
ncbi:MAG: hypothetical protein ACYTDY_01745 [Planctomycetota bacterium]